MDKGLYEYDQELKQYRRKYPREKIQTPDPEKQDQSADIYSSAATPSESKQAYHSPGKPPANKVKAIFWLCFVVVCGFWIYLIYIYINDENEAAERREQRLSEKEEPNRTIPLRLDP